MLCNRRYGIGADDVLFLTSSVKAHSTLRIFEPDGSEAEMSGNGVRCAAAYLCDKFGREEVLIDTKSGTKHVKKMDKLYRVDMGKMNAIRSEIGRFLCIDALVGKKLLNRRLVFQDLGEVEGSIVKVGEPHIVVFVDDVEKEDIFSYGEAIAKNKKIFPHGINVDLVHIVDESTIRLRTYERGVWDETMACGTGAAAGAAVSYATGRVKHAKVKAITKGGELVVEISEKSVFLTGPATKVYNGFIAFELK
jgi:diaminopimelate epimerase